MKYIIMAGGTYTIWDTPRHLTDLNGETVIERTIRLLRENGVDEIYISSNDPRFENFGVPVLKHKNRYEGYGGGNNEYWTDAFYQMEEEATYLFGDVVFSPEAIKTIVETETDDIELFASAPPFSPSYTKPWAEPFALKVANQVHLRQATEATKVLHGMGMFMRNPIMWELWQVIRLNHIDYASYTVINDYTVDIDYGDDIDKIKELI